MMKRNRIDLLLEERERVKTNVFKIAPTLRLLTHLLKKYMTPQLNLTDVTNLINLYACQENY